MVGLLVHSAAVQDRDGAVPTLQSIRRFYPFLRHIFADGGYSGDKLKQALTGNGDWTIEVVRRCDDQKGFKVLPRRWVVERTFAWLGRPRRLAKDWEKSIQSSTAWTLIAHIRILMRSPRMRGILIGLYGDWLWLDKRIEDVSGEIEEISRTEENCANVMTIPGIGPMISTAMVAAVGKGEAFDRGRDFAAWVGLVPRQFSTGGRTILGRITKRGSRYLRMLFVQAAKVIMMRPHRWSDFSFGSWLTEAVARMPRNKAAIALANKLARTAWSILRNGTRFDAPQDAAMEAI
jgi:transposase